MIGFALERGAIIARKQAMVSEVLFEFTPLGQKAVNLAREVCLNDPVLLCVSSTHAGWLSRHLGSLFIFYVVVTIALLSRSIPRKKLSNATFFCKVSLGCSPRIEKPMFESASSPHSHEISPPLFPHRQ